MSPHLCDLINMIILFPLSIQSNLVSLITVTFGCFVPARLPPSLIHCT
uniref:Uncharacterized protein n=1 Tax=Setaria italica TaxID=4555 RepID=K4APA6_SETIT